MTTKSKTLNSSTAQQLNSSTAQQLNNSTAQESSYIPNYYSPKELTFLKANKTAAEGIPVYPYELPKDWDDLYKLKPQTNLAAGNNLNLDGQHSPNIEKSIDNAFSGDIPLPKNEEIPPALAPLWNVADFLDKDLAKEKLVNEGNLKSLAVEEQILAKVKEDKLTKYAQYLGRGGTIYVHVLYYKGPVKFNNGKTKIEYTKKHYEDAATISNEKFKKLDINLSVVVIFDENANPLSREEFQTRKADKTKRKTMPKGFDNEYNPMDSYMIIDANDRDYIKKNQKNDNSDSKKGSDVWFKNLINCDDKNSKAWSGFIDADNNVLGKASEKEFMGFINSNYIRAAYREFGYNEEDELSIEEIDKRIANIIAIAIEHEIGHTKFAYHASVSTDRYNDDYLFSATEIYSQNPDNNQSLQKSSLKNYFTAYDRNKFVSRENSNPKSKRNGHIRETIMDQSPKMKYIKSKELAEGYDEYMVTLLRLLHGTKSGKSFSVKAYQIMLADLRTQRNFLLAKLLDKDAKNSLSFDEDIKRFDDLERQIEAYVDILVLLDNRKDFQKFLENQALIQKNAEEKSKPNATELKGGKNFLSPKSN